MAIGTDRVQVIKVESTALGGDDSDASLYGESVPIDPQEDAIESAGFYLQDSANRDELVGGYRDGDDLYLFDKSNTPQKLSDLVAGSGGLTVEGHKILRQLIHFIDDGPAEGFASGAYREVTGTVFPTNITWWKSSLKAKKIVERNITWTGSLITTDEWKVYHTDGSTVLATVSDAISYTGIFETHRIRTITT